MVKRDPATGSMMTKNISADLAALYPALKLRIRKIGAYGQRATGGIDARIDDERICEIGYKVRACSLGQASTAVVARHALGLDRFTVSRVEEQLQAILAGSATRCEWPELEIFALIKDVPMRHGSVLLPFEALRQLFVRAGMSPPETTKVPMQSSA